ncbi:hypothetical protein Bca52824_048589 [Brassica carinata]|uniref:DUF1985 domain-containing protein n=1 Tax=Brassica carinata TaxID=52824 RepID=A0A8X7RLD7_BRACI|nr:hypothetical protein Bca52824_048589 [Brassica carinata]
MKKSKLSQTTVRRRTRSSGEELPERPPAKQQRYPGMCFIRIEGGPVVVIPRGQFSMGCPHRVVPRLFAYGAYPTKLRPTARYGSQTRVLVHLGPDPLRFSLDEFRDVTGLNCGAFDVQDSEASESVPPTMWNKLFDTAVGKLTVLSVLRMLGNEYLAVEKRLPLALIALVDGVLCPSNKDLKLTPRYVEMLSDVECFLAYPWGRESFLMTVPRFLPPLVVGPGANPLQVMHDRLSQKTTVCYGFPLALQLFVFDAVPLLLEKIPDAGNTATFIDSPRACSSPSTILTVNEIVVVEEDPDRMQKYSEVKRLRLLWLTCLPLLFAWLQLSVHFTVIPDEERLLLVDQNEDRQVTSLVQKLICGELFKPEDFPGGDQSFFPKFKVPDAAQGEGACPTPVRQINLRPRNTAPIEVEDISSSGNSGEENRQCSERCTHENLKHWISQRFEGMENNIEELRTLICKSLGLPEGSKRNPRKRKAMVDPQVRRTPSPDDRKKKENGWHSACWEKNVASASIWRWKGGDKGCTPKFCFRIIYKFVVIYCPDTFAVFQEVSRKNPPSSERESGHQNDDDHAKETSLTMNQQETQSNALVQFGDVLDVEPESYVLPAEVRSPVAWEKTKPNCYSSVGSVCSFHPSWDGNPSSKSKGHQKWVGAPPVGYESVKHQIRMMERALVNEINPEIPGADEVVIS